MFLTEHEVSAKVQNWFKSTLVPDESFVPTMARISRVKVEETPQRWRVEQDNVPLHNPHLQIFRNGYSGMERTPVEDHSGKSYTIFRAWNLLIPSFRCM